MKLKELQNITLPLKIRYEYITMGETAYANASLHMVGVNTIEVLSIIGSLIFYKSHRDDYGSSHAFCTVSDFYQWYGDYEVLDEIKKL